MRALVLAQGDGWRWDGYLGRPKHLVEIDGETLLARTVRLARANGVTDVVVVGPDDPRYRVPGTVLVTLPDPHPTGTSMDKFLATRDLWNPDGRTIILWGDVWYSEPAMATIAGHPGDDLWYFRRPGKSKVTGHGWDESFAVSWGPADHDRVWDLAIACVEALHRRQIPSVHIRTHYAAHLGLGNINTIRELVDTPGQTVIDDWTDDFDSPADYAGWVGRRYRGQVDVAVVLPWQDRGHRDRNAAKTFVHDWYTDMGVPIFYGGEGQTGTFNRSAAIHQAVNRAGRRDVYFVGDTDTFVPRHQLWAAAYTAAWLDRLVIAYTEYARLSRDATGQVLAGRRRVARPRNIRTHHTSGAIAVPHQVWRDTGGFDQRFTSWGAEDRSFYYACNALRGRVHADRIHGRAWHLYHRPSPEKDRTRPDYQANHALGLRYKQASGVRAAGGFLPKIGDGVDLDHPDTQAMLAILREPGGPLAGRG